MFSFALLVLAASSVSAHSISHLRRHHAHVARATPPAGWATSYLEPYDTYHDRYLAIDCEAKHNTTFFSFCCHPLLATQTLAANRPACCDVGATAACPGSSASASASAAAPTESSSDDEDCDNGDDGEDEDEDCDDDGDDEDEDCDDDGDDETDGDCDDESSVVFSTHVATSTHVAATTTVEATSTTEKAATTTQAAPKATTEKATTTAEATTTAAPTTTDKATTTAAATTATTADSSSATFFTGGVGTWFTQNGVAGACGTVHPDTALIVALQTEMYANGANCGRQIQIIDTATGTSQTATVADECPTCKNEWSVDFSEGLFQGFTALSVGEINIKWRFTTD